jgi:hypothetical protein
MKADKVKEATPGPWTVSQQQGLKLFIVGNDEAIAEVFQTEVDGRLFANANLLAASWEMLQALEAICAESEYDGGTTYEIATKFIEQAEAAISKARGEER